jgi:hypothetical protein
MHIFSKINSSTVPEDLHPNTLKILRESIEDLFSEATSSCGTPRETICILDRILHCDRQCRTGPLGNIGEDWDRCVVRNIALELSDPLESLQNIRSLFAQCTSQQALALIDASVHAGPLLPKAPIATIGRWLGGIGLRGFITLSQRITHIQTDLYSADSDSESEDEGQGVHRSVKFAIRFDDEIEPDPPSHWWSTP